MRSEIKLIPVLYDILIENLIELSPQRNLNLVFYLVEDNSRPLIFHFSCVFDFLSPFLCDVDDILLADHMHFIWACSFTGLS